MRSRIFIDECLSVSLIAIAKERGVMAEFGPHIGMAGWQDWNIARFAVENDYVVVTNNRRDFLREYLKYQIHSGLIVVVPNVDRDEQNDLFSRILDRIAGETDDFPTNKLVEILRNGTIHVQKWTSDDHDLAHLSQPSWL